MQAFPEPHLSAAARSTRSLPKRVPPLTRTVKPYNTLSASLSTLSFSLSLSLSLFSRLLVPLLLTDGLSREFKLPFSIPVKDFGPDPTVSPAKPELAIRHVRAWCSGPFIKHILDSEPWVCSVRDACSKRATTVVMTPGMYQEKVREVNCGDPRAEETGGRRPAGGLKRE